MSSQPTKKHRFARLSPPLVLLAAAGCKPAGFEAHPDPSKVQSAPAPESAAAPAGSLMLEDEDLRATFDPKNGALTTLVNKRTGWKVQRRPELGLSFRLLVPLPDQRNNPVNGERQKLAKVEKE